MLADSGSTKTDWLLLAGNSEVARIATQGINPFMLDEAEIVAILTSELLADAHLCVPMPYTFMVQAVVVRSVVWWSVRCAA